MTSELASASKTTTISSRRKYHLIDQNQAQIGSLCSTLSADGHQLPGIQNRRSARSTSVDVRRIVTVSNSVCLARAAGWGRCLPPDAHWPGPSQPPLFREPSSGLRACCGWPEISPGILPGRPVMRSLSGLGSTLTCATFSRKVKGAVLRTAPRHASAPAPAPGLTWAFAWQVLDSNQGRHTSTVYRPWPVLS
jgi:hypothetical protein